MTLFDKIQSFDAEELAVMFAELLREQDLKWQRRLADAGIEVDIVSIDFDLQVEKYRRMLESEVNNDETMREMCGDEESIGN